MADVTNQEMTTGPLSSSSKVWVKCEKCPQQLLVKESQAAVKKVICRQCFNRLKEQRKEEALANKLLEETGIFSSTETQELPRTKTARRRKPTPVNPNDILKGLEKQFPKLKSSKRYSLSTLFVFLGMSALFLTYLSAVAAVGYGISFLVIQWIPLLSVYPVIASIIFVPPIFVGLTFLIIMFKPLWASPSRRKKQRALKPEDAPVLYRFVQSIACAVNAPIPQSIHVVLEPNASAHFRGGLGGLRQNDLVLTLGLPLFSSMNLSQFAGVLAHELGHFSQGGAMRLRTVATGIHSWLAQTVTERDAFDETLDHLAGSDTYLARYTAKYLLVLTWSNRILCGLLFAISKVLCCLLSRQMEFDADSYEVRLVGPEVFEQSLKELTKLQISFESTLKEILCDASKARATNYEYPNNLPLMVSNQVKSFSPDLLEMVDQMVYDTQTSWFDSHPSDGQRLEAVCELGFSGQYENETSAVVLLPKFRKISTKLTVKTFNSIAAWLH